MVRIFALAFAGAVAMTPRRMDAQATPRWVDTTFAFAKGGTVIVGDGAATIIVEGWDQQTIRVKAKSDDGTFRFEPSASRVRIETMRQTDDAVIQISVPRGTQVVARTS